MKQIKLYPTFFLIIFLTNGCIFLNQQDKPSSHFKFEFDHVTYSIRSTISFEKERTYNELIGNNLVVVDIDRDGIVDQIVVGKTSLAEAQIIYDFGLNILASSNKLKIKNEIETHYVQNNTHYNYQLKSFHRNKETFNEFRITNKQNDPKSEIILIDKNADGNLDEVLKGDQFVDQYQEKYNYVLTTGLEKNKLVKSKGKIFVKE